MARSSENPLNERPEFNQLKLMLAKPDPSLLSHHLIGKYTEVLCPDDTRTYGSGGLKELAEELLKSQSIPGKPKPQSLANLLSAKRKFYNTYRHAEVKQLNKAAKEGGFALTWSHVKFLLTLDDPDIEVFQARCIEAGWSSGELHRRIKEHLGVRGRGGVRFRRPDTEEDNLRQLIEQSETWQRRFREVWFPDDGGINLDVKKAESEELRKLREKAATILGEIQSGIEECLAKQKRQAGKSKKKAGGRVRKSR